MAAAKDITGLTFGRLTAMERVYRVTSGRRRSSWRYRCECGETVIAEMFDVRIGRVKSCGCLRAEVTRVRWAKFREAKAERSAKPKSHRAAMTSPRA
jgi:hypothetical protein